MASEIDLITGAITNANSDDWRRIALEADNVAAIIGRNTLYADFEQDFYAVNAVDRSTPRQLPGLSALFSVTRLSESLDFGVPVQHLAKVRPLRAFAPGEAVQRGDGLRVRPPATNLFPNPRHIGAIAGTPGTLPNEVASVYTAGLLSVPSVGAGVFGDYFDVRLSGEPTGGLAPYLVFDRISWAPGTAGRFLIVVQKLAGDMTHIDRLRLDFLMRDSAGAFLGFGAPTVDINPSDLADGGPVLAILEGSAADLSNANLAAIDPRLLFSWVSGVDDITLRIHVVHVDQAAYATPPVRPLPGQQGASIRMGDDVTAPVGDWFRAEAGTLWARFTVPETTGETQGVVHVNSASVFGRFSSIRTDLDRFDLVARNSSGIFALHPTFAAHGVERGKSCVLAITWRLRRCDQWR